MWGIPFATSHCLFNSSAQFANLKSFHWYSSVYIKAEELLSCSNKGVCWIHFGLGFLCSNAPWRKRCRFFLQASPHFLTDKQLSLVSYLTKPCDERKPLLYLQVTSWAKGEKADLCKAKSRDRLGGECRGKKQDPAGWGWEYSGKCPCVDSRAMYFLMSVRKRKY